MEKLLLVDPEKCIGCRTCEMVCSVKHKGYTDPTKARVQVLKYNRMGDYYYNIPMVCQQCETPMCMEVCPTTAINKNPETGAYLVDTNKCVGCRLCTVACPLGAIYVDPEDKTAFKCDLCDGDPLCAKFCLQEAITFVPYTRGSMVQRREAAKNLSERLLLVAGGE